jgi:hypothetical protein
MTKGMCNRYTYIPAGAGRKLTHQQRRDRAANSPPFGTIEQALILINNGAVPGARPEKPHTPEQVVSLLTGHEYTVIGASDEVRDLAEKYEIDFDGHEGSRFEELYRRGAENMTKFAGILAVFDAAYAAALRGDARLYADEIQITANHINYAKRLVDESVRTLIKVAGAQLADDPLLGKINAALIRWTNESNGDPWVPHSKLVNHLKSSTRRGSSVERTQETKEAIERYVELGELLISTDAQGTKKRLAHGYVCAAHVEHFRVQSPR